MSLFLNSTFIDIDGTPQEFFFLPGSISMTNLTLPTNGKDVIVPEDIIFSASGFTFDTMQTLNVSGGAKGWIADPFSNGLYYPSEFHRRSSAGSHSRAQHLGADRNGRAGPRGPGPEPLLAATHRREPELVSGRCKTRAVIHRSSRPRPP